MKNQLELDEAVKRIFGPKLKKISDPTKEWNLFTCFKAQYQEQPYLFKLLEVPASYHISEEIYSKKLQRLGNYLHKVKFFFVERSFQSSYYVLQAEQNLISLQSLIRLSKQSGQKISQETIYQFLSFTNLLEKSARSINISFNSDQIGKTANNQYKIANYELYFQISDQQRTFNYDVRNVLFSLITLNPDPKKISIKDVFSICNENYNEKMRSLIQRFIQNDCCSTQVQTLVSSYHERESSFNNDNNTTLTQSFIENIENISQVFANDQISCEDISNTSAHENEKIVRKNQSTIKKKRFIFLFVFFIIVVGGIGAITFKYFGGTEACGQSEFFDKTRKKCMGCALGCERCQSDSPLECLSCKGEMYLIHNDNSKIGECRMSCQGKKLNPKQCLINQAEKNSNRSDSLLTN